ncbi:hypothetical protein FHX74_003540 [Friedmanniella endophytica]|uniref:DUF2630 family protein n=1 Tax=Microlunatus kandeliicorticis TaxID=1759536 RepID=A0A7W3P7D1_9ACTN|nr:DUF2630 family protein [Microlunatus kandeliicorticis]MBA8795899.1 hypothetical protein [Microlunatus kandeliicorticis]
MAEQSSTANGDRDVLAHIHELIETEHRLRSGAEQGTGSTTHDLAAIERQLDQCWDLLRQRRARQEFAQDPDEAHLRPENEVEGYQQ